MVVSPTFAIDVPDPLLAQARAGRVDALEQIYRLFEQPAYTLALRLLADPHEARETLHDALLAAFDRLGQFRGESPFWAWLRQIVANTALMRLRRRRRVDAVESCMADDHTQMGECGRTPLFAAESGALTTALAALPDTTRSVVWLYCVEGYSHPEIAGMMSQSVSFSKSQLARGLARLRRLLNVEEPAHA
jgi:RNA polymerase sigma factor (sigma-70 family)